jgi:hypothetical protein
MLRLLTKQLKQIKPYQRIQQQQQQLHQQSAYRLLCNSHNVLYNSNNKSHNNNIISSLSSLSLLNSKKNSGISCKNMSSETTAPTYAKAATSNTPTISDVLVELTFVDPKGARRKVKGMVGTYFFQITFFVLLAIIIIIIFYICIVVFLIYLYFYKA